MPPRVAAQRCEKNEREVICLDEEQVRSLLRYDDVIAAMERALADFSSGRVLQPVRTVLTIEEGRRYFGIMPAVAPDYMATKLVSFYPGNAGTKVPTHNAAIVLLRTDTGEPVATMGATVITEMRTAAVSAAVTKHLMRKDSHVLAILGSGVQARSHLEALRSFHDFEDVRVWSPTTQHAEEFARRYDATATPDAASAVRDADVVVTATAATEPVLHGAWLKRGAHVNSVGANRPTYRELDDDVMGATLVVDSRDAASKESGDVILSNAKIVAEIGEIFAGTANVSPDETTVFKSMGLGVEDLAAAKLVYEKWLAK